MRRFIAFLRANPISKGFRRFSPITRACILMVLATLLFAAMHTAIRYMAQRISGMEVAFFRNLFGLIVIVPVLARYGPRLFYTEKLKLHVLRACINALSMISFFVGLSMTPIARATDRMIPVMMPGRLIGNTTWRMDRHLSPPSA